MQADLFSLPADVGPSPAVMGGRPGTSPPSRPTTPDGRQDRRSGQFVRDTSRAAYRDLRDGGKLGNTQQRIYAFLARNCHRDYTRSEISKALGMPINVVAGRVNELIHVKSLVVEKAIRACEVSGKRVHSVGLP